MSADGVPPSFPSVGERAPDSVPLGARVAEAPYEERESQIPVPIFNPRTNAILFVLTVLSVFYVGQGWTAKPDMGTWEALQGAWVFAVPLLSILVAHEFGHYIAARIHRVPASLPYFIPFPILNPFGTMGAVIIMPRRIRSANALLDIGAAGPIAGMVVAIPVMLFGLSLSELGPRSDTGYIQEGQSILYWALKAMVFGSIPADQDVHLHPTALAAVGGLLGHVLEHDPRRPARRRPCSLRAVWKAAKQARRVVHLHTGRALPLQRRGVRGAHRAARHGGRILKLGLASVDVRKRLHGVGNDLHPAARHAKSVRRWSPAR